jgi:hypothetical protein
MSDSTYQGKVYDKQGGDELVVASGGKITVEAGGEIDVSAGTLTPGTTAIADGAVTTTKLAAGAATLPKIDVSGIKCLAAAGKNGSGAVTLTGTAIGDRVVAVFGAPTAGGALAVKLPGTDFEAAVTVADQIQQLSASNLSANTYVFILIPAAA